MTSPLLYSLAVLIERALQLWYVRAFGLAVLLFVIFAAIDLAKDQSWRSLFAAALFLTCVIGYTLTK